MSDPSFSWQEQLVEYHLGLLAETERAELDQALADSPELVKQSRRVAEWLGLLDAYAPEPAPEHLVDTIMARVDQAPMLRSVAAGATVDRPEMSALPPAIEGGVVRRPAVSLRELVALAACLTFLIGVLIPGVARMRSKERRALCQSNLGRIYEGATQYAASFNGALPQAAGFVPGVNWLQPARAPRRQMSNSRNRYLLVRLRFVAPQHFVCPSVNDARPMTTDRLEALDDFPGRRNCSYDSQNMAGPTLPLRSGPVMPILADRNPLFANGDGGPFATTEVNSRSHDGGSGQNVLCNNGQVRWLTSPVYGPQGDNIWQVEGVDRYTGTEYQHRPDDSFLIP